MEETVAFEAWKHIMYNMGLRKQYKPNMIALQVSTKSRVLVKSHNSVQSVQFKNKCINNLII